jgi:transcriptional regulator with XRE-family HTH domain
MATFKESAQELNLKMATHLKTIRKQKRFSMRQLAAVLNVPHSFVGKIETQGRRLDVAEFTLYCQALEVDPVTTYEEITKL